VGSGGFDFIRDLGAQMPMRTIGMLLGIPEQDQEAIRDQIDESLALDESGETKAESMDTVAWAESLFGEYIDWRAQHPSDDLMTQMLEAEFEDEHGVHRKLTRTEVVVYVSNVASAGNETTTRLIGWMGKVLAEHPDQLRDVAESRELVNQVVEEVLRYEAPSPVQARYVTHDVELHGRTVPEGSIVLMLNGAANRDDRHFENGDSFDVRRRIDHHLSFGYGLHFCLGASLARLEGRIALDEVLQRWQHWEVDYDNAVQARTSTVRGWQRLPVLT
jgi:cytochrome P450